MDQLVHHAPIDYQFGFVFVPVTEQSFGVHHLDVELQAKEGAGLLPGLGEAPAEQLPVAGVQIRERVRPH